MRKGHRCRPVVLFYVITTLSCTDPDPTILAPPSVEPVEVAPGLFRMTFNTGPDVVRGFSADGSRILYRSQGLAGFRTDWRILSLPKSGGQVREEGGLYQTALVDNPGAMVMLTSSRILVGWKAPVENVQFCNGGTADPNFCPRGSIVWAFTLTRLPVEDGPPLSSLSSMNVLTPFSPFASDLDIRLRTTPVTQELTSWGVNPFGPVVTRDESVGYYSDGEAVWRFTLSFDSQPDSIVPGSFPAVSADGSFLASVVGIGLDSTSSICVVPGLQDCRQETVTVTGTGWETIVWNLETSEEILRVDGLEPQFDPAGGRILIRRSEGLYWVRLDTASEELIPGTSGAMAPSIAPDGNSIAFSRFESPSIDVYLLRLR